MQKWFVLLIVTTLFLMVAGCTQEAPSEQPSTAVPTQTVRETAVPHTSPPATAITTRVPTLSVSDNTITILKNAYKPSSNLTVKVHSTVRWVNGDDHPHNIEFANKQFSSSHYLLAASQSFSQRFDSPGTYDYDCLIHPAMRGTITVVE